MRFIRVLALIVVLTEAGNPLAAQVLIRTGLRIDVIGCYRLFIENGRQVDSTFYNASPLVRLDSVLHPLIPEVGAFRILWPLNAAGRPLDRPRPHYPLSPLWWADSLSDSVHLSFSDGFSGTVLILSAVVGRSDTLRGTIEEDWDFVPPTKRGAAYAVRVPCLN